jgi:regulator of sigma E protease
VNYEHAGVAKSSVIVPVTGISSKGAAIGIYMDMVGTLKLPFFAALKEGVVKTYEYTQLTVEGIWSFLFTVVTGHANFTEVTGPVGIVKAVGAAATIGFANVLLFTALISINLAVINIIPFPALDGGRLLFVIIEGIMRRPIPTRIANYANIGGFALLMILMLLVTYHDVVKLF